MKSPQISNSFHLNLLHWTLLAFVVQSSAQTYPALFQWSFDNSIFSSSLPTCVPLPIVVKPLGSSTNQVLGTPPYYMTAFVVDGTSVTTLIGIDPDDLSYTVTERNGSQLALSVVDANGRSGGVPSTIYRVIDGQTTQCIATHSEFKITANVTRELSTCQPWRITITGGVPPYNITIQTADSGGITHVTIPVGYDSFTYINRAEPNTELLAAVRDFTGRWANGTAKVITIGSTDTNCTGLVNSIDKSSIQQHERQLRQPRYIIVLVVIPIFVIGLAVAVFLYWRTRTKEAHAELDEVIPRPFMTKSIESGPLKNVSRHSVTLSPSTRLSSTQDTVTRVASSVQLELSLSRISTNRTYVPSDGGARGKAKQNVDSRPFPVSGYSSFDDTSVNTPRNLHFFTTASFATFPLTSIRETPQYNRGPGKKTPVINQHRKALSVEAEIFYNEPALSDSGSDILPIEDGQKK